MEDTCPFCGAELEDRRPNSKGQIDVYECWTWAQWHSKGRRFVIGSKCKDHQISALQASRNRWRELALVAIERIDYYAESSTRQRNWSPSFEMDKIIAALKQAGEWEE